MVETKVPTWLSVLIIAVLTGIVAAIWFRETRPATVSPRPPEAAMRRGLGGPNGAGGARVETRRGGERPRARGAEGRRGAS